MGSGSTVGCGATVGSGSMVGCGSSLGAGPAVPVPKALHVLLLRFVSSLLLAMHISHMEHFRQSELPLGSHY
ncbi:MAG: hypothetical protein ACLU9T_18100 [Blautia faecis]